MNHPLVMCQSGHALSSVSIEYLNIHVSLIPIVITIPFVCDCTFLMTINTKSN